MNPLINRRDLDFLLYEFLDVTALCQRPRFQEHGRDTFDPIIDTALSISEQHFAPHAEKADQNEPQFDGKTVTMIPEVKPAVDAFFEAGFGGAMRDYEQGGMQLPATIYNACHYIFHSANVGTAGYPFLTVAAANLLNAHGSEEQKNKFLPLMIAGKAFGTMCLSEPQAGSSLADITTKAVKQDDGSYKITGNKMWISAGEHELADNIIHMVLAKVPDAPPGVKGISLFIVPKYVTDDDGNPIRRNDVALAGLNHKMGYRGTTNTLLNFGENDQCTGYLVGEENAGLGYMFHMMNEARIGVGLVAVALGNAGYLYSLDYAKNRTQGRRISEKNPSTAQIPIIEHSDVKRMLLTQKAYVEGALALCLYCSKLVDQSEDAKSDEAKLLDLLTPIAKAWPSEWCLEANKWAIQILGGYGYTRDYPVERFYRDNRLNMIHEGTNGIQGLDLLGRKIMLHDGDAFRIFLSSVSETVEKAKSISALQDHASSLENAVNLLESTTATLVKKAMQGEIDKFLANSSSYLEMFSHVVLAWMWLGQAFAAYEGIEHSQGDEMLFYQGKIDACRFYFLRELPKTKALAELLSGFDMTCVEIKAESF